MTVTRNDHFIPQYFLSHWTNENKQVWILNKSEKKIFPANPKNICADRIWSDAMEKHFTKIENDVWFPALDRLIETKNPNCLSEIEILNFLSFVVALQIRDKCTFDTMKRFVDKSEETKLSKFKLENNATINEILDAKIFPNCFLPQNLFKLDEQHQKTNQLKKFRFGIVELKSNNLSFLTSDNPVAYTVSNTQLASIWLAITPNLLFFGAKDTLLFQRILQLSPESLCIQYNSFLFQSSKFLISNNELFINLYSKL